MSKLTAVRSLVVVLALGLFATACDTMRMAQVAAPRVASAYDRSSTPPAPQAEPIIQMASLGQSGLLALTSEGQVWMRPAGDQPWFKVPDDRPQPAPLFINVAGTPQGTTFAVDQSGQMWRYFGGWIAEPSPGE